MLTQTHENICSSHVEYVHVGGGPHVGPPQPGHHHQQVPHHPHHEYQQVGQAVHQLHREGEDVGLLNTFTGKSKRKIILETSGRFILLLL